MRTGQLFLFKENFKGQGREDKFRRFLALLPTQQGLEGQGKPEQDKWISQGWIDQLTQWKTGRTTKIGKNGQIVENLP